MAQKIAGLSPFPLSILLIPTAIGGRTGMRPFGKVEIPQEAFIAALKMDED